MRRAQARSCSRYATVLAAGSIRAIALAIPKLPVSRYAIEKATLK
jgi:hypothetical protein